MNLYRTDRHWFRPRDGKLIRIPYGQSNHSQHALDNPAEYDFDPQIAAELARRSQPDYDGPTLLHLMKQGWVRIRFDRRNPDRGSNIEGYRWADLRKTANLIATEVPGIQNLIVVKRNGPSDQDAETFRTDNGGVERLIKHHRLSFRDLVSPPKTERAEPKRLLWSLLETQRVDELFDKTPRWEWSTGRFGDPEAHWTTSDGAEYVLTIGSDWRVDFYVSNSTMPMDKGRKPYEVLAAVRAIVTDYITHHNPSMLAFRSATPAHAKVYRALLMQMKPQLVKMGYEIEPDAGVQREWITIKKTRVTAPAPQDRSGA